MLLLVPIILEPLRCRIQLASMIPLLIPIRSIRLLLQMLLMLRVKMRLRMVLVLVHMLGRPSVPLGIADATAKGIGMVRGIGGELLGHGEVGGVVWDHVHGRLGYGVCRAGCL